MALFKRIFLVVLDGFGVGEMPDAERYGDKGSRTFQHIVEKVKIHLPVLSSLGLPCCIGAPSVLPTGAPAGFYGKMAEKSAGKDTSTGHWELMGVLRDKPPKTYPKGFPKQLLEVLSEKTGYEFIGNKAASGTEIIKELGEEHLRTGRLIIYTSADSVLQIAAHKSVIPVQELYRVCKVAREICVGQWEVDRIIARPFDGSVQTGFKRTPERKDFSIPPPSNYIDLLHAQKVPVALVGKLEDIFTNRSISLSLHTRNNMETMKALDFLVKEDGRGLVFANLIDFDMLYGHRNDPEGYALALMKFDLWLGCFLQRLRTDELLIITSDHGNDPVTPSTDHSREYVPLIVYFHEATKRSEGKKNLGTRETFADVGATIAKNFGLSPMLLGTSFLRQLV